MLFANKKTSVSLIACLVSLWASAQDKDRPLITPYPGSSLTNYLSKDFDEFTLPLAKRGANDLPEKSRHLEGRVSRYTYTAPEHRSLLEVWSNYDAALKKAGFESLFSCVNKECGDGNVKMYAAEADEWNWSCGQRDISAKLSRPEGDAYVNLFAAQSCTASRPPYIRLYVIEMKPMETGLVTVDAAALAGDITRSGHAAVYGIYFDTGKSDIKAESEGALKEIAKLLQQNPRLKIYVVGHTDNQGSLDTNLALSSRRADAVRNALSSKYGIAADRLRAYGDGPYAPVASNKTEEGRAKNRRVELVEQ